MGAQANPTSGEKHFSDTRDLHLLSEEFFTPKEAAAYLKIDINTLYIWARKGEKQGGPPVVRILKKKHLRFPRKKFISWVKNGA